MGLNLRQTVYDFLKAHAEERFTAREVAQWIFDNFREACEEKRSHSKQNLAEDSALIQQLAAEISTNRPDIQRRHPQIKTTESRPRRYFYSAISDEAEVAMVEKSAAKKAGVPEDTSLSDLSERDLYPLLCRYLHTDLHLLPKRIDEKRASNKRGPNGNKWLFPDLVGMEDLSSDWNSEIKAFVNEYGARRVRLWSFEVKRFLNRSNVRESWFQAVSNSSWANFGYLVANEIDEGTMKELHMLAAAHGIGLIRLNADDPSESQILIPARERANIDWDACNRLAEESPDFMDVVKIVRQFHQTGDPRKRDWDIW